MRKTRVDGRQTGLRAADARHVCRILQFAIPLTFTYVGQAEAPQGKADVLEAKAPTTSRVRFFVNSRDAPADHGELAGARETGAAGRGAAGPGAVPPGAPAGSRRHRAAAPGAHASRRGRSHARLRRTGGRRPPAAHLRGAGRHSRAAPGTAMRSRRRCRAGAAAGRTRPGRRQHRRRVPASTSRTIATSTGSSCRSGCAAPSAPTPPKRPPSTASGSTRRSIRGSSRFGNEASGCRCSAGVLLLLVLATRPRLAQAPRAPRCIVTVVDPERRGHARRDGHASSALDDATKALVIAPVKTTDKGIATLERLAPAATRFRREFPGFEPRPPQGRPAARRRQQARASCSRSRRCRTRSPSAATRRTSAADRRSTFGTAMTREQIEALSDDPDEMAQQLQDMAGPTPCCASTASRGPAAAEGADQVDPHHPRRVRRREPLCRRPVHRHHHAARRGAAPRRRQLPLARRIDERAQSAHHDKGPGADAELTAATSAASLMKNRSSFSLVGQRQVVVTSRRTCFVYVPGVGTRSEPLDIRAAQRQRVACFGLLDYAITRDQTLRVNVTSHFGSIRGTSASAATTRSSAPSRPRTRRRSCASRKPDRSAGASSPTPACSSAERREFASAIEAPTLPRDGRADDRRRRRCAAARHAHGLQSAVRSRLRPRHPLGADRHQPRWRFVSVRRLVELSRHLHVREPRGLRRGPAAQLHAAHRRSEHQLPERPGRHLSAGRHPRAQEPDAQSRACATRRRPTCATTTTSGRASA